VQQPVNDLQESLRHSSSRSLVCGRRRRHVVPLVALARILATVAAGLLLAGCSDATGAVDAMGHNGYDVLTCTQGKALAMDMEHGTLAVSSLQARLSDLRAKSDKASDEGIRQSATSLIAAYLAQDTGAAEAATTSLLRACQM